MWPPSSASGRAVLPLASPPLPCGRCRAAPATDSALWSRERAVRCAWCGEKRVAAQRLALPAHFLPWRAYARMHENFASALWRAPRPARRLSLLRWAESGVFAERLGAGKAG